tara:strand:- start:870 stop:1202 length:333 start_codon:yes stop_codon:yes gene_type:complete
MTLVSVAGPVAGPAVKPVRAVSECQRKGTTVDQLTHQLREAVVVVALALSVRLRQVPAVETVGLERLRALPARLQRAPILLATMRSAGAAVVEVVLLVALAGPVVVATAR